MFNYDTVVTVTAKELQPTIPGFVFSDEPPAITINCTITQEELKRWE